MPTAEATSTTFVVPPPIATADLTLSDGAPIRLRRHGAGPVRLAGSGARLLAIEALAAGTETWIARENAGLDIVFVAKLGLLADPALTPPRPIYLAVPGAKVPEAAASQPSAP